MAGDDGFLDDWLKKRAAQSGAALEDDVAFPGSGSPRLDLDSLLPKDTGIGAIESRLRESVHGQSAQIRQISVLLSMHFQWARDPVPLHTAPNAIIIGPTGSGKTFTLQTAAREFNLPFASIDSTALVPSGIVGLQIEDILGELVSQANTILSRNDLIRVPGDSDRLAARGIILLDEFDKLSTRQDHSSRTQGASEIADQVQRRLLKVCEGSLVGSKVPSHTGFERNRQIDTSGILIVASGAFSQIAEMEKERPTSVRRRPNLKNHVLPMDISNYGFLPELVARLPVLVRYERLTAEELVGILKHQRVSPLTVWQNYLLSYGVDLELDDDVIALFAQEAYDLDLGARGLQQVVFRVLASVVGEHLSAAAPENKISIAASDLESSWNATTMKGIR